MNNLYNYIHSYFYTTEDKDNKDIKEPPCNKPFIQEYINFEKNIQKYNPKYKIQKPPIKINQD